jgi:hypothetical protein
MQHCFYHTVEARPFPSVPERHNVFFPKYVLLFIIHERYFVVEPMANTGVVTFGGFLERHQFPRLDQQLIVLIDLDS